MQRHSKDTVDYAPVIAELTESIPEQMSKHRIPGLSVALVNGDALVWAEGFGYTDRTGQHAVTTDTLFSLQSISKTYTATGFLIAVNKGMVDLDDALRAYYPAFRIKSRFGENEADKITFRHLLSHWSGLCHEAPVGNNFDDSDCTFEEHIWSIADTWLMYPVGQRFSYSNLGIDLAGYALQLISGKPFIQFMQEELFGPLGMTDSTYDQRYVAENRPFAKGHTGKYEASPAIIPMIPAGSVFSSAREMAKFVSFHLAGGTVNGKRILDQGLLEEMYRPQFAVDNQAGGYGLGIRLIAPGGIDSGRTVLPTHNTVTLSHGGGGYGYLAIQEWLPEYNIGIVVLTNSSDHEAVHQRIAQDALGRMIKAKCGAIPEDRPIRLVDKPVIRLDASAVERFEGNYRSRGGIVPVRVRDGALCYAPSGGWRELSPRGGRVFTAPSGALVTFHLGEGEEPKGLQLLDNSGNYFYPLDWTAKDAPGPNRDEWKAFTGIYSMHAYGDTLYLCTTIRNGHLFVIMEGGGIDKARLREYGMKTFFASDGAAVIFGEHGMTYGNMPLTKETAPYEELLELAEVDPENRRLQEHSLRSLGNAYSVMGDSDKAIEVFLLNAELYPESISALQDVAESYFNKGDAQKSAAYCDKILELDSQDEKALSMLRALEG